MGADSLVGFEKVCFFPAESAGEPGPRQSLLRVLLGGARACARVLIILFSALAACCYRHYL